MKIGKEKKIQKLNNNKMRTTNFQKLKKISQQIACRSINTIFLFTFFGHFLSTRPLFLYHLPSFFSSMIRTTFSTTSSTIYLLLFGLLLQYFESLCNSVETIVKWGPRKGGGHSSKWKKGGERPGESWLISYLLIFVIKWR